MCRSNATRVIISTVLMKLCSPNLIRDTFTPITPPSLPPGYLSLDEVGRITESYNTIYNLGIPFELINRAIAQATEPSYGFIQLSVYTDVLMNLFLNSV